MLVGGGNGSGAPKTMSGSEVPLILIRLKIRGAYPSELVPQQELTLSPS